MYVLAYTVVVGYFLLAAISPQATTIPNTWHELARVGVLALIGFIAFWWGNVRRGVIVIHRTKEDHPDEGFPRGAP